MTGISIKPQPPGCLSFFAAAQTALKSPGAFLRSFRLDSLDLKCYILSPGVPEGGLLLHAWGDATGLTGELLVFLLSPQLTLPPSLSLFSTGDMGVGKSCLLHQFTEKKCKCRPDFLTPPLARSTSSARVSQSRRVAAPPRGSGEARARQRDSLGRSVTQLQPFSSPVFSGTINGPDAVERIHSQTHAHTHTDTVVLEKGSL